MNIYLTISIHKCTITLQYINIDINTIHMGIAETSAAYIGCPPTGPLMGDFSVLYFCISSYL